MALSPADFAAYSRATGTPYPEDPEERAELAPEVLEFRRNQLRGQQEESNLPGILGAVTAGLGVLGAAALGARRLAGRTNVAPSKKPVFTQQGVEAVQNLGAIGKQQRAEEFVRQAREERPAGVVQTSLTRSLIPTEEESLAQYARQLTSNFPKPTTEEIAALAKPSQLGTILTNLGTLPQYRPDPQDINYAKLGPVSAEVAAARRDQATQSLLHFARQRQEDAALVSTQAIAALGSGEDQITGRTMLGAQRNEDLDLAQINSVARQTGSADIALANTSDGVPVDQTNALEQAQSFLSQQRQELTGRFSPTRAERVLSSNPAIAEAAELYAATGDPSVLSRFSQTPSSPLTVKPAVQMSLNDTNLPTSQFFKPTGLPEYTGDLLVEDIELTNQISKLGTQQEALGRKAQELGEQELMLRVAMEREPASGGAYSRMFAQVKNQQQKLPDPSSLNVDIGDALAERDYVRGRMKSLQDLGSTYKMTNVQEGVRPYYEYDELGRIIPETLEIRGGRPSVDLGPKTGGGRLVAEYDPAGQTGSSKGIYGIEPTAKRSGPTTRPTRLTTNELVEEALEQASASPEGDVPIPPPQEQVTRTYGPQSSQKSLIASEALRRARIEGRDPQVVLRNLGFNV